MITFALLAVLSLQPGAPLRPADEAEATSMAHAVWAATWPVERIRQRAFFTFGMDVLLSLDLFQMREFFRWDAGELHMPGTTRSRAVAGAEHGS